jgi:hypothetical protein
MLYVPDVGIVIVPSELSEDAVKTLLFDIVFIGIVIGVPTAITKEVDGVAKKVP